MICPWQADRNYKYTQWHIYTKKFKKMFNETLKIAMITKANKLP
jgi:hypothetical protein